MLFRVSMLTTLALVLLGLLVLVLYSTPDRDVPMIVSVVSKSGSRLSEDALFTAPNPYAAEDVELLRAWFGGGEGDPSENVRLAGSLNESSGAMDYESEMLTRALTKPLKLVKPGGPGGDMIAMYLSAHGFVDKGTPFLAVGDSRSDQKQSWVSFEDLFQAITTTLDERDDAGSGLKLVLFIDAARVGPQWDWGQFSESFAEECEKRVAGQSDRIAVILSASPGERSWWDPREGHGLFTKALVEALTLKGDLNSDGVVKVGEIADYLRQRVHQMSTETWDSTQRPILAGESGGKTSTAREWAFISQPNPVTPPATPEVDVEQLRTDFASVDELWQRHNQLAEQIHPPLGFDPLGWSALEKKLSRLDALLLAGKGYRSDFQAMLDHCKGDLTRYEIGPDTLPQEASLPELALLDYFYGEGKELESLSEEQRLAFDEMVKNWRTKKPDIPAAVQVPMTEAQATRFLWDWIKEKKYNADSLTLASDLLEAAKLVTSAQAPGLLESQFTRLLSSQDLSHVSSESIGLIVEAHEVSRKARCTNDLRASFWIRDQFQNLNAQRLDCLDRMMSKDADQQAAGRDRWKRDVKPAFESLIDLADDLSKAYKLRDAMLHAIPRIAETLMHDSEAFLGHEQLPGNRSYEVIERAIESLAALSASLQLPRPDDNRPINELQQKVIAANRKANEAFDALNNRIIDRLDDAAVETAGDAEGLRQNFSLLVGSGTSSAELRQRVHSRVTELIGIKSAAVGTIENVSGDAADAALSGQLQRMTIEGRHAWDFWLSASKELHRSGGSSDDQTPEESTPDTQSMEKRLRDTGSGFRDLVAQLTKGDLDDQVRTNDVMQDPVLRSSQKQALAEIRRELETWDTFLRSRTMLFSNSPSKVEQIGKGRFALDQQLFLFDHASHTMEEFWCEGREGDKAFFVGATNRLLSSRLQNPLFPSLASNLDGASLSDRLASATQAIGNSSTLQPLPGAKYREGTLLKFVLGKDVDFVLDRPAVVPPGQASMWTDIGNQAKVVSLGDASAGSIDVPVKVPEQLLADEAGIEAGLFFRGLRRQGRIVFTALTNGKRTVFRLPAYDAPKVRVTRQSREPERLLLVFDCSLSMQAATGNGLSRLAVAQNAVSGFLNGLKPDVEVGLIVFGDRYGFQEKEDPKTKEPKIFPVRIDGVTKLRVLKLVNRQPKDGGLIVANEKVPHNPNFDVRVGVPINPLDNAQLRTLKKEISGLGAIGTTPTYLAIRRAYEQLGRRRGHIIVLTDGKPTIVTTPNVNVDDSRTAAINDYQNRKNDVQLTIVKYLAKDTQLRKDFIGATVLDAANGKDLLRHLQNVRSKPEVVWERNREEASQRADFESLVAVSEWPPKGVSTGEGQPVLPAEPFSVRAMIPDSSRPVDQRAEVRVEGGEQFELLLAEGELSHQPYDYEYSLLQTISTSKSDASRFKVSAGPISKRENRQLTIQLAIESASGGKGNGKFTPRPTDIWVELTGIDSRQSSRRKKETYQFSLPEFETGQPIPILLCRIDDFSEQYDKVEVKAWMRFDQQRLKGVAVPADSSEAYRADGLDGVTFRTQRSVKPGGGIRITVTEQYASDREPGSLRVLSSPLPDEASTVLYASDRVVTRKFDFDDEEASISLSAISSEELKRKSTLSATGTIEIDFDSR